jgi:hypothetical protein
MERLTASNYRSLVESYSAVYDEDLRSQLNEEQQIQEFLEFVDALLEEGYDLSEYTYDELYDEYITEAGAGSLLKALGGRLVTAARGAARTAWKGTTKRTDKGIKVIPGAKETTKELLARTGKVAPVVALALGADQAFTGGKGREWVGSGLNALGQAGRNIPSPSSAKTQPSKPEDNKKNAWDQLQSVDLFDLVKGHLLDEGYADTEEAALQIMANMSEEWRETIIEAEVIAAKDGVPGTMKVKPTKEGGFLGIGAKTVNKPVPGSFNPSNVSSIDAARYNNQVDKNFTLNTGAGDNTDSAPASTIQRRARSAGHSGYMKVNNPDSIPDTGIPNRPSPGRARDQNRARG